MNIEVTPTGTATSTATIATETTTTTGPENLYAAISLAAGLTGLFWIAIIFATIAHGRPGGRTQALVGGALGYTELLGLALWFVYQVTSWSH